MGLDQGSHVLTGTRHQIDQQRLQPDVRDLSGDIQQDNVGAPPDLCGEQHRPRYRHQPTDCQQTSAASRHTWPAGVPDRRGAVPSRVGTARDRLPRARMTPSATRRAAAPHPATNRYSGPKARSEVSPTKKSPGTLLSNQWLRLGIALSVLISARSDGSIIVNFVISTVYPVARRM